VTERRIFLSVLLVATALAAPLRGSSENRTLVLLTALERGRFDLDDQGWNSGDRSFVPTRLPLASIAFGGAALANPAPSGHTYSNTAPGLAFTLLPIDLVLRGVLSESARIFFLVLVGAVLPHAAGSIGIRRAVLGFTRCSEETASLAALTHGFGTIAFPMATRLMYHALPVALLAWALALIPRGRHAAAGLLAAWAVVVDHNSALAAASVGVMAIAWGRGRGLVLFALGAVPSALVLGAYDTICFGAPWKTSYSFSVVGDIRDTYAAGMGFSLPRPAILFEILFGARRGSLFTQPAALLGLAGLASSARRDALLRGALAAASLVILANAARSHDWAAGNSFGPRYSIYSLPFLALGLPRGVEVVGRAFVAVAATSAAFNLVAASTNWGFSAVTTYACFFDLGPRTIGVTSLLLGPGHETNGGAALVAVVVLGIVLPGAILVLRGRIVPFWLVLVLALAPAAATLRFARTVAASGPSGVERLEAGIRREEARLELEAAWHPDQARRMVVTAAGFKDPWLYERALERVVELDPQDTAARQLRDDAIAVLRSASRAPR